MTGDPPHRVILGNCVEEMGKMDPASVDAVVCDPPYGLKFMEKEFDDLGDGLAQQKWHEAWAKEALRILKPGGHLLAFGGTRTYHRLTCALEDVGFEIRDSIGVAQPMAWVYAQGFPKGRDIAWELHKDACNWHGYMEEYDHEERNDRAVFSEQNSEHKMRFVRATYLQTPVYACAKCGQVLQPFLSQQDTQKYRKAWSKSKIVWSEQSSMEGRGDLEEGKRELQRCEICKMSHGIFADGSEGWIYSRAQTSNGSIPWEVIGEEGSGSSYRPQSLKQYDRKLNAISVEQRAQELRGFNLALKPAWEPIVMARKSFKGTVASNVLEYGTGALNVDGCRVGTNEKLQGSTVRDDIRGGAFNAGHTPNPGDIAKYQQNIAGRWPANVVLVHHPGCEYVGTKKVKGITRGNSTGKTFHGEAWDTDRNGPKYADENSEETVEDWNCHEDCPAKMLDEQSGELKSGVNSPHHRRTVPRLGKGGVYGDDKGTSPPREWGGDSGGASRFFYCAKASKAERNLGCDGLVEKQYSHDGREKPIENPYQRNKSVAKNNHPTVKPVKLMRYLCRLVGPPGGVILDPFCGSGSTGIAALLEGFEFIGIDENEEYVEIARQRISKYRMYRDGQYNKSVKYKIPKGQMGFDF